MSMKRTKEVSRGRGARELEGGFWDKKGPERVYNFETEVAGKPDDAFVAYVPTARYEKDALVVHTKFGKGIVIDVEPQRVEVLFSDGPRKLSHGLAAPPPPRKVIEDDDTTSPASEEPVTKPNPT
jgi:hypothetical protein